MRTREELSTLMKGIGIELGVAGGQFSKIILKNPRVIKLYSVDKWSDRSHTDQEYEIAKNLLKEFGERSEIIRQTFSDALNLFEDKSLDFIYIDGYAHTGQDSGQTLRDWWPKLKMGGIFSGHDYHDSWPLNTKAIDEFIQGAGQAIYLTTDDRYPSWFTFKFIEG